MSLLKRPRTAEEDRGWFVLAATRYAVSIVRGRRLQGADHAASCVGTGETGKFSRLSRLDRRRFHTSLKA
jgi:hypothetical protein